MAETESFIDIMKETRLPETDVDYITSNPEGLTKEGVEFNIREWRDRSRNQYAVKKYTEMLRVCKNLSPSGKTSDGKTILGRVDGKIWAQKID